jgi:hypothetical protein
MQWLLDALKNKQQVFCDL